MKLHFTTTGWNHSSQPLLCQMPPGPRFRARLTFVLGVSIKGCFIASPPFPEFVARKKESGRNKIGVQGTGALMEGAHEVGRRPFMRRMPLQDERAR